MSVVLSPPCPLLCPILVLLPSPSYSSKEPSMFLSTFSNSRAHKLQVSWMLTLAGGTTTSLGQCGEVLVGRGEGNGDPPPSLGGHTWLCLLPCESGGTWCLQGAGLAVSMGTCVSMGLREGSILASPSCHRKAFMSPHHVLQCAVVPYVCTTQ